MLLISKINFLWQQLLYYAPILDNKNFAQHLSNNSHLEIILCSEDYFTCVGSFLLSKILNLDFNLTFIIQMSVALRIEIQGDCLVKDSVI